MFNPKPLRDRLSVVAQRSMDGLPRSFGNSRRDPNGSTHFVSSGAAAATAIASTVQAAPNDRITVAAIGVRGRGRSVFKAFASRPNVDVKYLVDVDPSVLDSRAREFQKMTGKHPENREGLSHGDR